MKIESGCTWDSGAEECWKCLGRDSDYIVEYGLVGVKKNKEKVKETEKEQETPKDKNKNKEKDEKEDIKFYTLTKLSQLVQKESLCLSDISKHEALKDQCSVIYVRGQPKTLIDNVGVPSIAYDNDESDDYIEYEDSEAGCGDYQLYNNDELEEEFISMHSASGRAQFAFFDGYGFGFDFKVVKNVENNTGQCIFQIDSPTYETWIDLDFNQFDYLFALSSKICHCHTGTGILRSGLQFQVSITFASI